MKLRHRIYFLLVFTVICVSAGHALGDLFLDPGNCTGSGTCVGAKSSDGSCTSTSTNTFPVCVTKGAKEGDKCQLTKNLQWNGVCTGKDAQNQPCSFHISNSCWP
jgi:hypothetical protein